MDDKSVCSFYQKIGACRHGERCSRKHIRPVESKTVLLANLYQNPKVDKNQDGESESQATETFEHFYTDIFRKLAQIGEVEQVVVCENENFHLSGNVYVRFSNTFAATDAVMLINQEWYAGRPVYCELSPVTSFHEANCRAYDTNSCTRGDHCNFMHVKRPSNELRSKLKHAQEKQIVLGRLRKAVGDEAWGKEWEEATTREYYKKEEVEKEEKEEKEQEEEEKEEEVEPTTMTEAVAKLFARVLR